jgi:tRNA pseudouridine55 synthase
MTDTHDEADADGHASRSRSETPLRPPPEERTPRELLSFGVINLDKPPGPSAHQVSAWVRDLADVRRAAHAGTLDPKVTGCLPVLTGDATRIARALLGPKEYVAVLELHGRAPEDLERVLGAFEGPVLQRPPRKSAVDRSLRVRQVDDLTVLESEPRRLLLRIECESGTYVRKLCHDAGLALGTGANMGDLRRTAATPFDDTDLVKLHDLTDALAFHDEGVSARGHDRVQRRPRGRGGGAGVRPGRPRRRRRCRPRDGSARRLLHDGRVGSLSRTTGRATGRRQRHRGRPGAGAGLTLRPGSTRSGATNWLRDPSATGRLRAVVGAP